MDPTRPRNRPGAIRRGVPIAAALLTVALVAAACSSVSARTHDTTASATRKPNIVFILTDDLSWNLITPQIAPHIAALEQQGVTFDHYFVADSLCCPSRSTIFTGLFPHDTKVTTNGSPDGGFAKFQSQGLDQRTYAVALRAAGYETSMNGKYLNGYGDPTMSASTAPIPPGWTDWHVSNSTGYAEFDFTQNDNGTYDTYNAAFFFDATGSDASWPSYRKKYLVPIVERVPFVNPRWFGNLKWFGGFGHGDRFPVYRFAEGGFGVVICYESAFEDLARRYRADGADFLVNITNDAWFGRTAAPYQHAAHLVMRAIETRMGVARAANTGISEFLDPLGYTHLRTPLEVQRVEADTVWTTAGRTPYVRLGDWVGILVLVGTGALVAAGLVRRGPRP